ncbi:MAG: metallophosphoesterase, partial [Proteobacteria bacterium]|nr:metallophosphoesterase [Pseudomonadota bacterium]
MKIAVIADIHGNYHGLEAILDDIEHENPEVIVGAGDMAGCSPHSSGRKVLQTLQQRGIPMVLGNHEEYILSYHDPAPNPLVDRSIRFKPGRHVAR